MAGDGRVSLPFYAHCVDCGEQFNTLALLGLHKDICGGRGHSSILCGHCSRVFDSYRVYSVHVNQLGYNVDLSLISGPDDSRKRGGVYPLMLNDFSTESPLSDENLGKMPGPKFQMTRKKKVERDTKTVKKTDDQPIVITSDTADEASGSATVSMVDTVREWKHLLKTVGINQISLSPTPGTSIPRATAASAAGDGAGMSSRADSHEPNDELAYYKKAALFFACGIRVMNEVASDVPPYFWPDDYPETCPYRAQVRESSWPSNFPDVGRCEHKELVAQMASNAGQILKGPRKQEPIDDSLIDDMIVRMLQTEDDQLMNLSGNLFGEDDDFLLGPAPNPM